MVATYATFVDFSTPSDWTLSGEAEIGDGTLTLKQPWRNAPWTVHNWGATPPFSNNGNNHAILLEGQVYQHCVTGAQRQMRDFQVNMEFLWADPPGAGTWFVLRRKEIAAGGGSWTSRTGYKSTTHQMWTYDTADLRIVSDADLRVIEDTWYTCQIQSLGTRWSFSIDGKTFWESHNMTALGVSCFEMHGSLCDGTQLLVGAGVDGHDYPIVSTRAVGAAVLKAGEGWTTPADVGKILKLTPYVDRYGIGSSNSEPCEVVFQYKYGAGAWTDLPDDGDLSGLSPAEDTELLMRVDDGNGTGMDNHRDMRFAPYVFGFDVIHTQTVNVSGGGGHIERRNVGMIGGRG